MGVALQRGSDLDRSKVVNQHRHDHETDVGHLPDETAFTEVG